MNAMKWILGILLAVAVVVVAIFVRPIPQMTQVAVDARDEQVSQAVDQMIPIEDHASTEATVEENTLPVGILPVIGADLRASADMNAEILGKAQVNPLEVLGKDLKNPDTDDDDWIFVRDGNDLEGWIAVKAVVENEVELDLSTVPDMDGSQPAVVIEEPAAPVQAEVVTVDYIVPTNAGRLWTEEKGVLGFFADCNVAKLCEIPYPAQSTLILALGGGTITDGNYVKTVTTDGTIGNLYANVCELQSGSCKATVTDFSAGNVRYTIVFAPFEVPTETLTGALNSMGVAPNCGGSGCPVINAYSKNGKEMSFKRGDKVKASHVSDLLTAPVAPFVEINLIYGSQPMGAEPIILNKVVVGSIYYLAESDSFVNVPEGGGTVFYCGANAEIDGKTCKAGTAIRFDGNKSDGSTPDDLNRTVKILSSEPNMIRVYMIYATDFNVYVEKLKADYPDWEWK